MPHPDRSIAVGGAVEATSLSKPGRNQASRRVARRRPLANQAVAAEAEAVTYPPVRDNMRTLLSSLGLCTPHDVHYGLAAQTLQRRAAVLDAAFLAHPERFARGRPVPATPPHEVWINKPAPEVATDLAAQ